MAEIVGKILEILEIPEVSKLYQTSIRKMQPAELVRRLESEKVSTRGHMPELRGRLLRLEARKSHPHLGVPWYPEDNVSGRICVVNEEKTKPNSERMKDDLLNKFFQLARYQEQELQKIRDVQSRVDEVNVSDKVTDKPQTASGGNSSVQNADPLLAILDKLEVSMQAYIAKWGDPAVRNEQKQLPKPTIEHSTTEESELILDEDLDEEDRETSTTIDSDESIVKLNFDNESFEKVDEESEKSWDNDSSCDSSSTSVYRITELE